MPSTASEKNHNTMTGPNTAPTLPVPWVCAANRQMRVATVIGMIKCSKAGVATLRPSTALKTEIAGVIIPSP